jgi:hypothetical protein
MKTTIAIRTSPLPEDQITLPEFSAPSNYKDPVKIQEYIAAAKARYIEDAAYNAMTGKLTAVGILPEDGPPQVLTGEEPNLVLSTLDLLSKTPVTGWLLDRFALPFLFRRAWKLGIPANPGKTLDPTRHPGAKPFLITQGHTDLSVLWQVTERSSPPKLADVAAFLLGEPLPTQNTPTVEEEITRELQILNRISNLIAP